MALALFADGGQSTMDSIHAAYIGGMRSSMFTGFLTLAGFLMSAKTFIVVNMKKEVYDNKEYLKNFAIQKRLNNSLKVSDPLSNLSKWLMINVVMSLITSISQFTIGYINHPAAALICLGFAVATVVVLLISLYEIRSNLRKMYQWQEITTEETIKSFTDEELATAARKS
jgi:hypothetical protein